MVNQFLINLDHGPLLVDIGIITDPEQHRIVVFNLAM